MQHSASPPEALIILILQWLGRPCTICHYLAKRGTI